MNDFWTSLGTRISSDRGESGVFLAALLPAFILLAGIAHDFGLAFQARRHAHGVALAAARAGAQQIDEETLYFDELPELRSDSPETAEAFAKTHGSFEHVNAKLEENRVSVEVEGTVDLIFLPIIGIDSLGYEVRAEASMVRYWDGSN